VMIPYAPAEVYTFAASSVMLATESVLYDTTATTRKCPASVGGMVSVRLALLDADADTCTSAGVANPRPESSDEGASDVRD